MSRTFGRVPDAGGLGAGDHVCWIYQGDEDHRAGLARYFADGLAAGERLQYLSDRYDEAAIVARLTAEGMPARGLIDDGRLVVVPAREAYPRSGDDYDLEAAVGGFRALADIAVADGFNGLRVAGEAGFLLDGLATRHSFLAYELACDLMVRNAPLAAMCLYDADRDPADRLGEIARVHAAAIVATSVLSEVPTYHLWAAGEDAVGIAGEVDFATASTVQEVLMRAGVGTVGVIDVSRLEFADVSAVRALVRVATQMASPQDRPIIRGASSQLRFVAAQFDATDLLFDG